MSEHPLNRFLTLSSMNQALLPRQVKLIDIDKSGPVIHKGDAVSGAYLVLEGRLRVFTYSPKGTEATLYFLRPGEACVLTLNCLFKDLRYPAWVEASESSRVALIPGDFYRKLFAEEACIQDLTVSALSTVVFRLMDELEESRLSTLEQRLGRFILNHASGDGVLSMTQQEIAGHLGTTREVIARLMQGLNAQSLVETRRGAVRIKQTAGLAALAAPTVETD
ncbi:MAG: Crp/Fnr family transcriptional regulator [Gammaproteobacteria bacterium]